MPQGREAGYAIAPMPTIGEESPFLLDLAEQIMEDNRVRLERVTFEL